MESRNDLITAHLSRALGEHALRHSAAIVMLMDDGGVDVGSATCVAIGDRFFLATAGHNFDAVKRDEQIRLVAPHRSVEERVPFLSRSSSAQRGTSAADVAWLELEPQIAQEAGFAAISLDSLRPFEGHDQSLWYFVQGLPAARAKHERQNAMRQITLISVGYLTIPSEHQPTNSDVDISLDYADQAVLSESMADINMTNPAGMSGGGIWAVERNLPIVWDPTNCHLVGIVRGFHERHRQLLGIQVQHWLRLVAHDLPELREPINEVLEGNSCSETTSGSTADG